MYHDLREVYWWTFLKRDIEEFVAKGPNCQHVKAEHLKSGGLTQIMDVSTWKWKPSIWTLLLECLELEGKMIQYGLLWIG